MVLNRINMVYFLCIMCLRWVLVYIVSMRSYWKIKILYMATTLIKKDKELPLVKLLEPVSFNYNGKYANLIRDNGQQLFKGYDL